MLSYRGGPGQCQLNWGVIGADRATRSRPMEGLSEPLASFEGRLGFGEECAIPAQLPAAGKAKVGGHCSARGWRSLRRGSGCARVLRGWAA